MTDGIVRIVAAIAAVAIAGAPAFTWMVGKVRAWRESRPAAQAPAIGISEMRTVLDLAERCKVAGCVEGVSLCQQLIDVMLGGCQPLKGKR